MGLAHDLPEPPRDRRRLGASRRIEGDVGAALDAPVAIPVGLAVAHEI
jgi:hypothetical protein